MSGLATSSRARTLGVHAVGAVAVSLATARLYATGGYAVAPAGLLTCPLHAATGLWCPFCGGLRSVAALSHGEVIAALSANAVVVLLVPLVVTGWLVSLRAAVRGTPNPVRVTNPQWAALFVVLAVFVVWRNVSALPYAAYLTP